MCGINGIFAYNPSSVLPEESELIATRDHMAARGPDGAGKWWSSNQRICLGHRRLAIIDLSKRADQPMKSADNRFVIVFNGEIYNHLILRKELEAKGKHFNTQSDTEVLLHLFELEGESMVHRLRGMFAFSIWDNQEHRLFIARDAYGIKPLYTANDGWTFRFASQVKALLAGGQVSREPDPAGIVGFHLWGSVPEPFTLYRSISALPAGHYQWIDEIGPKEPVEYASIPTVLAKGNNASRLTIAGSNSIVESVRESVEMHLISDVEVGVFLSAGVDSGALLGLMRDSGHEKIKAITLAFDEFQGSHEDEVPLARKVAQHYGAKHVVRRIGRQEFLTEVPHILEAMDQPSIDGINTWFVAKAAKEAGLKVALSGVGGDEILAGYPSFKQIPLSVQLFRFPSMIPKAGVILRNLIRLLGVRQISPKATSLLEYGGTYPGAYFLKRSLFLPWELSGILNQEITTVGLRRLNTVLQLNEVALTPDPLSSQSRVASLESSMYLRNQLLRDADWAGMAHSVEIRTPLVDFELLRKLAPITACISGRAGKSALAHSPKKNLPPEVEHREKTGFGTPTGNWALSNKFPLHQKGSISRAWALRVAEDYQVLSAARTP